MSGLMLSEDQRNPKHLRKLLCYNRVNMFAGHTLNLGSTLPYSKPRDLPSKLLILISYAMFGAILTTYCSTLFIPLQK